MASNVTDGTLAVSFAGARGVASGEKEILRIFMERKGSGKAESDLEIERAELNGGRFRVDTGEGARIRPWTFALLQNQPNPFNPETTLRYEIPEACQVRLEIFDMLGQRVRTLVREYQAAGSYEVRWNGLDDGGRTMASGLYFYRLQAEERVQIRKMTLLR